MPYPHTLTLQPYVPVVVDATGQENAGPRLTVRDTLCLLTSRETSHGGSLRPLPTDRPWGNRVCSSGFQCSPVCSIADLWRATSGGSGLDLCASSSTVLTPEEGIQALPTGVYGTLLPGTLSLILGCASSPIKGLQITPGIIDTEQMRKSRSWPGPSKTPYLYLLNRPLLS